MLALVKFLQHFRHYLLGKPCRRSGLTYGGELKLSVRVSVNGSPLGVLDVPCGVLPVMVMSRSCNLSSLPRSQFYLHGEEVKEIGGYFIVHGKERVLRLLIMSRRNYPLAISRPTFKKRGHGYTERAIVMRCVREDETVSILMLHWLVNGEPALAFIVEREQFLVPISIILRALVKKTEFEIFDDIRRGCGESFSLEENAMRILIRLKDDEYSSQTRALCYLGGLFRRRMNVPDRLSDEEAGKFLLSFMIKKLHAFVSGLCCEESNDNPMFQEVLLPSTLYLQVLRAKVVHLLANVKEQVLLKSRKQNALLSRASEVSTAMVYMVSTGNLPPSCKSTLSAQLSGQSTGLSVPADNVNFLRFAAQFRAVHRGAFFTEMRTTSVRRLLPEAWGFFCPVHTPDGAPCGLLNHLAEPVEAVCETPKQSVLENIGNWLSTHKLRPIELSRQLFGVAEQQNALPVLLDGRLIGWLSTLDEAKRLALELRNSKVDSNCKNIPHTMEIALVPSTDVGSQYPGLYLFAGGSRLLRPVKNLQCPKDSTGKDVIEWIGTFEQVYLNISVKEEELSECSLIDRPHIEIAPENIFSFVAGLIPYPDFNQGYDMEDAMVINKASYDRGLAGACIYKSEVIDLSSLSKSTSSNNPFQKKRLITSEYYFGNRVDSTPFQWSEDSPPYEDYCQILTDCGFNHWGTETMMSGSTGRQLEAQIYVGVVYYQRLRHMVADKYQVRAEGRFDPILRQPIKGRKVGGGIRLGEMERDCLLSHGLVFSLQDRLVDSNCDKVKMLACSKCGGLTHSDLARNITNTSVNQMTSNDSSSFVPGTNRWCCRLCDSDSSGCVSRDRDNSLKYVQVSAAFRYLTYELACLNVKTRLSLTDLE
uniref:DNA-directed RNA polymerase n=1 Tax=Schistosoma haematobium TaxID=6185 RepID=A0A094ZNV1_SCHHA